MAWEYTISDKSLSEWEDIYEEATPGEWEVVYDEDTHLGRKIISEVSILCPFGFGHHYVIANFSEAGEADVKNAQFIAMAKTAIPMLIEEVRRLRKGTGV